MEHADEQLESVEIVVDDVAPVIAPGHTYATVTDQISSIVLSRKPTPGSGSSDLRSPLWCAMVLL